MKTISEMINDLQAQYSARLVTLWEDNTKIHLGEPAMPEVMVDTIRKEMEVIELSWKTLNLLVKR